MTEDARFTTDVEGRLGRIEYWLTDNAVHLRTQAGEKQMAFTSVASVSLVVWDNFGICTLKSGSGEAFSLSQGQKESAAGYKAFVRALHQRLAERGAQIRYTRGAYSLVVLVLAIELLMLAVAFGMELVTEVHPRYTVKLWILKLMAGVGVVAAPILAFKLRPRAYDPKDIPESALS